MIYLPFPWLNFSCQVDAKLVQLALDDIDKHHLELNEAHYPKFSNRVTDEEKEVRRKLALRFEFRKVAWDILLRGDVDHLIASFDTHFDDSYKKFQAAGYTFKILSKDPHPKETPDLIASLLKRHEREFLATHKVYTENRKILPGEMRDLAQRYAKQTYADKEDPVALVDLYADLALVMYQAQIEGLKGELKTDDSPALREHAANDLKNKIKEESTGLDFNLIKRLANQLKQQREEHDIALQKEKKRTRWAWAITGASAVVAAVSIGSYIAQFQTPDFQPSRSPAVVETGVNPQAQEVNSSRVPAPSASIA